MSLKLKWRELHPFGAEVLDIDLLSSPEEAVKEELRRLFAEHHLLLFRGPVLTQAQQHEVVNWFGPAIPVEDEVSYVSNARPDGILGNAGLTFHSDNEYCAEPLLGLSLHAIEVENDATSTLFVDGARVARSLSAERRASLEGLEAVHAMSMVVNERVRDSHPSAEWPRAIHKLIKAHPITGEPILYATYAQTDRVLGMSDGESTALLDQLFETLYDKANILEHYWRVGDLLIWDNVALQHGRAAFDDKPRTLQRVAMGTSFVAQHPLFAQTFASQFESLRREGLAEAD